LTYLISLVLLPALAGTVTCKGIVTEHPAAGEIEVSANTPNCPQFEDGVPLGTVQSSLIIEASGLAASRKNADILWTHNDSGDSARVFAMNTNGNHLGIYNLSGVSATDWEDIAIGPGPVNDVDYLYLADIGDNSSSRSSIKIYRVPEPAVDANQSPSTTTITDFNTITLQYPDGARNAETLMVDPVTKDIYIVTKEDPYSRVYRAAYPQSTTQTITLQYKCQLPWSYATGGDISPNGTEIIIKNDDNASLWKRPMDANLWDAFAGEECTVPLITEPQGEAVCFVKGYACGYITVSEGSYQPINYFQRIFKADLNDTCCVDLYDFAVFAPAWLSATKDGNWNPDCDISDPNNNFIDANDLYALLDDWLAEI